MLVKEDCKVPRRKAESVDKILQRPPLKANINPYILPPRIKITISNKLPENFFSHLPSKNREEDLLKAKRVLSLPKLVNRPLPKEQTNFQILNGNLFVKKPNPLLMQKMKMDNFMNTTKKKLVL